MATGGYFPSNKERTNYARLCRAIVDLCTEVLRQLLSSHVHPAQIVNTAHRCPLHALDPVQWTTISDAKTKGYTDFDISLLCTLLRNIRGIRSPAAGWGGQNFPVPRAIDVADDIERIRLIRNEICGHSTVTLINDVKYQEIMTELQGIMNRFDSRLGATWSQELTHIGTDDMDPESQTKYIDVIKDFEKSDRELKREIETIRGDQINFKGKLDKVEEQTKVLGDGLYKQNTRFAEYEIQQREDQDNLKSRLGETEQQTKNLQDGLSKQASRMGELETKQRGDQINFKGKLDKVEEQTKVLGDGLYKQNTRFAEYEIQQREHQDNLKSRLDKTEQQTKNLQDGLSKQASRMEELETKQRGTGPPAKKKPEESNISDPVPGPSNQQDIQGRQQEGQPPTDDNVVNLKEQQVLQKLSERGRKRKRSSVKQRHRSRARSRASSRSDSNNSLRSSSSSRTSSAKSSSEEQKDLKHRLAKTEDQTKILGDGLSEQNTRIQKLETKHKGTGPPSKKKRKESNISDPVPEPSNEQYIQDNQQERQTPTDDNVVNLKEQQVLQKLSERGRKRKRSSVKQRHRSRASSRSGSSNSPSCFSSSGKPVRTLPSVETHRKDKSFVSTKAVVKGFEVLMKQGMLIYTGIGGCGKTKNALEVMKRVQDSDSEYQLIEVNDISKWQEYIDPQVKSVVLLDDCLGRTNLNTSILHEGDKYFRQMSDYVKLGKIMVIMTIRKNILNQSFAQIEHHKIFTDEHIIDLSSLFKLRTEEKKKMFKLQCQNNNISICSRLEKDNYLTADILDDQAPIIINSATVDCIVETDPPTGFPQSCYLFARFRKYTRQGIKFFRNPRQNLIDEIDRLRKSGSTSEEKLQYCVLSYMLLKGGEINMDSLDEQILNAVIKSLKLSEDTTDVDLRDAVSGIKDKYIVMVETNASTDLYRFQHETILEAVTLSFAKHNTRLLIQLCSENFIKEFIRGQKYVKKEGEIILKLQEKYYEDLANRFSMSMEVNDPVRRNIEFISNTWPWLSYAVFDDTTFVNCFMATLKTNQKFKLFVNSNFLEFKRMFKYACLYGNILLLDRLYNEFQSFANLEQKNYVVKILDQCLIYASCSSCTTYGIRFVDKVKWILDHTNQKTQKESIVKSLNRARPPLLTAMLNHKNVPFAYFIEGHREICQHADCDTLVVILNRWPNIEQEHLLKLLDCICQNWCRSAMQVILNHQSMQLTNVVKYLHGIGRLGDGDAIQILLDRWPNMDHGHLVNLFYFICKNENISAMQVMLKHSPIQFANVVQCLDDVCRHADCKTIDMLLKRWPNLEQENVVKLFHAICRIENERLFYYILKERPDVITQECITEALTIACVDGLQETIKCLLNIKHNNINNAELHRLQNEDNVTYLHVAAFCGRFNVLKHLLKTFTDLYVTQRTKSGLSVLQIAMLGYVYNKHRRSADMWGYIEDICPVLKKYFNEEKWCSLGSYIEMLHYLIKSRDITMTDLDMKLDPDGNTLAHYCVMQNAGSLIGRLSAKYSSSLCLPNNKGYKPINVAAVLGRSDIFQLLYCLDNKQDASTSSSAESLKNLAVSGKECLDNKRIAISILESVIGFPIPFFHFDYDLERKTSCCVVPHLFRCDHALRKETTMMK